MLTSDLLLARNIRGKVYPTYIKDKDKNKYLNLIQSLINIFQTHIGLTMDELKKSIKSVYDVSIKKKVMDGLIKLLIDRCEFVVESKIPPEKIREEIFLASAKQWKNLDIKDKFDREKVLIKTSKKLDIPVEKIESHIYADLKGSKVIQNFNKITPIELFNRYNLSLAQAVLFKAIRVEITIRSATPKQYREIFRYIKFFRLIYTIIPEQQSNGYKIILDGPFSLFKSVQKYGYQMALFLPVLLILDDWEMKADLLWGKFKQESVFELDSNTGLVSHYKIGNVSMLEECEQFFDQFKQKKSEWDISLSTDIINLKGKGICIPDFVFKHKETKNKVYMEVFGYWSRDTVWKRIELLENNFPHNLILAVSKKLRVSEKAVKDELPGHVYVYSSVIMVKAILKILDKWKT